MEPAGRPLRVVSRGESWRVVASRDECRSGVEERDDTKRGEIEFRG